METLDPILAEALRRQAEDSDDHDLSLIDQCLSLTPDQRLERLKRWVRFVAELRDAAASTER